MHITFLTRKYPPQTGGMETFSWQLYRHLPVPTTVIAVGKRQRDIMWILPVLLWRGWRKRHQTTAYHLGDLVLVPLASWLRRLTGKPVVVTVHGLELVYRHWLLRRLIKRHLPAVDQFVCVSDYTAMLLAKHGIPSNRITVIPHGVKRSELPDRLIARKRLRRLFTEGTGADTAQPPTILLSVGRLVPRKGIAWFISNVMPRLRTLNIVLMVVSGGPDRARIQMAIEQQHLTDRVLLLGKVTDDMLRDCYSGSDIFIMPNLHLAADAEGFGFVAIEAAAAGLPVLASNVDGIPTAIHDRCNGKLLPERDAAAWAEAITSWHSDPELREACGEFGRSYTLTTFSWQAAATAYVDVFETMIAPASDS